MLASGRNAVLVEAMEKANDFHNCWKCEVGWLAEAEKKAYADWKPCGLPETCEADLVDHEVLCMSIDTCVYNIYSLPEYKSMRQPLI